MYTLPVKSWFHNMHMPNMHTVTVHTRHLVHDPRFWLIVAAILIASAFIALAIWAGMTATPSEEMPFIPYTPYY